MFLSQTYFSRMTNDVITKIIGYCENTVPFYSFCTFRSHFRLTKTSFETILNHIARCPEFVKRDESLGGWEQITVEKSRLNSSNLGISKQRKLSKCS
jgi:hypothetical protein